MESGGGLNYIRAECFFVRQTWLSRSVKWAARNKYHMGYIRRDTKSFDVRFSSSKRLETTLLLTSKWSSPTSRPKKNKFLATMELFSFLDSSSTQIVLYTVILWSSTHSPTVVVGRTSLTILDTRSSPCSSFVTNAIFPTCPTPLQSE